MGIISAQQNFSQRKLVTYGITEAISFLHHSSQSSSLSASVCVRAQGPLGQILSCCLHPTLSLHQNCVPGGLG